MTHRTTQTRSAKAHAAPAPAAEAWQDGAPRHIPPMVLAVDRRVCRHLRCPGCRKRGMDFHPQHQGERYRVLARCPDCGVQEEL